MKRPLLLDQSLQKQLELKGWVSFPFLKETETNILRDFYSENTNESNLNGFHATMFHSDLSYRAKVDQIIKKAINNSFNKYFHSSYHQLYANYMVKEKGEESNMKWHQDWAYVHENEFDSYAIWIPLLDLNEQNGAFTVAESSHELRNYVRGPGVDDQFIVPRWIGEHYNIKPLFLKAGEAVVWHHRLLHASPPNFTNTVRIAVTAILKEKDAENIYFYKQRKEKFIREYSIESGFYSQNRIDVLPESKLNKKFFYDFDPILNKQSFESFKFKNRVKRLFSF